MESKGPHSWTPIGIVRWVATGGVGSAAVLLLEENLRHYYEEKHWNRWLSEGLATMPDLSGIVDSRWFWFFMGISLGIAVVSWLIKIFPNTTGDLKTNAHEIYISRMIVDVRRLDIDHCVSIGAACFNLSDREFIVQRPTGYISLIYGARMFPLISSPQIDYGEGSPEQTAAARSEFTVSLNQIIPGEHVAPLIEELRAGRTIQFDFENFELELRDASGKELKFKLWERIVVKCTAERPHVTRLTFGTATITRGTEQEI